MLRDTYLQINLNKLKQNMDVIQNFIGKEVGLGAVLKANAYGHGALEVAEHLYKHGLNNFLVATLSEAVQLRKSNSNYHIMVMGHTPDSYLPHIIKHQITCTIFTLKQALILNELASNSNQSVTIHLKIETGFNRLGMQIKADTVSIIKQISNLTCLNLEGAFTHLALKNSESDQEQAHKFNSLMNQLEEHGINIPVKHIVDSIGMVLHPEMHLSMVRVGALLYGLQSEEKGPLEIKPIMRFLTKLSHQKTIEKGESLSYGLRYVSDKKTNIGTLPFGYSDGYPRNLYQKGEVTINHKRYPIVGVICMDQCMVDLGDDVYTDEEVIVIGDGEHCMSVDDLAKHAMTNKNDIVSRFTSRVPRVYVFN